MTRRPESVVFGHMHEDHSSELFLAPRLPLARALVIASGGDLAFLMAGAGLAVTAVDSNPAQVRLVALKMRVARDFDVGQAASWMTSDARELDVPGEKLRLGLCFSGKVDRILRRFGPILKWLHDLSFSEPDKMRFTVVDFLQVLLRLGVGLVHGRTARASLDSRAVFLLAKRLDYAIRQPDAETNPLLQVLLGRGFGKRVPVVWSPGGISQWRQQIENILLQTATIEDALAVTPSKSLGLISVSNIADLMPVNAWQSLIQSGSEALAPGGYLIARSMLGMTVAEAAGDTFADVTNELRQNAVDRSPLCPIVWAGKRKATPSC